MGVLLAGYQLKVADLLLPPTPPSPRLSPLCICPLLTYWDVEQRRMPHARAQRFNSCLTLALLETPMFA